MKSTGKPSLFLYTILPVIIFFLLGLIGILNHEMWRDEYQAWLIASNSHSIPDLFHNIRYEGHPSLWFLLLFLINTVTNNTLAMQLLHLLFSTASIFLIFRYSPFNLLQKILLSFSYYLFFEYSIISRNYAIGVFLFLSFIAIFPSWRKHVFTSSAILALLANTNIYGLMIALTCGLLLLLDIWFEKPRNWKKEWFLGIIIFISGVISSVLVIKTAPDAETDILTDFTPDFTRLQICLGNIYNAFIPLPDFKSQYYWNSNFISFDYIYLKIIIGFGLLTIFILWFSKDKRLLIFFLSGVLMFFLFNFLTYLSFLRHIGHYFIFFLGCFWLSKHLIKEEPKPFFNYTFSGILALQLIAGIFCFFQDIRNPFSESEHSAKFIKRNNLQDKIITGVPDYIISPFSTLLNKPVYYLEPDTFGTFVKWDKKRNEGRRQNVQLSNLVKLSETTKQDIVFLLDHELTIDNEGQTDSPTDFYLQDGIRMQLLSKFNKSAVMDENYVIYLVTNEKK